MLVYEGNYQLFLNDKKNIILSLYHEEAKKIDENPNIHQQMEVFFVIEGRGEIEANKKKVPVTDGDILIFDSMVPHRISDIDGNVPFVVMAIMFDVTAFIRDEYKVFHKDELNIFFSKIAESGYKIPHDSKIAPKIQNVMFEIENEFLDTEDNNVIRSFIILLLSYLVLYNKNFEDKPINKTPHKAEIEKTMVYINQHLDQNLTLEKLARIASMNKTYYSTIFKKVTGMTVWEYILNTRIELAISYLVKNDGEFNITEILSMCGFNNATSFNKTFKKITGKTPTEYKNSKNNSCFSE